MNKSVMRAGAICALGLWLMSPTGIKTSVAQTKAAQAAAGGDTTIVSERGRLGPTGGTLEGNVVIKSPDLGLTAQRVDLKRSGSQVQEVRAEKDVTLKVSMAPRGTGAPTRIEATCDVATLDPVRRKLTLRGKVTGWYDVAQRGRTVLNTDMVVLYYQGDNLLVDLTGGVRIDVPAEATTAANNAAIGAVTITSRDASIDEGKGIARFTGNARAVSDDTINKFDVSAPEFIVTRNPATKTIDTIKTSGRTTVKMDLPPEPVTTPVATVAATDASTPGAATDGRKTISRPTHVEVVADSATVTRATSTLVFSGNVQGFYVLSPAGSEPEKYDFSGDRADITYVTEEMAKTSKSEPGLRVNIEGNLQIGLPSFDFNSRNK